jgi:hypothetical protein
MWPLRALSVIKTSSANYIEKYYLFKMSDKKIVLYICDYFCNEIKRRREIQMVLNANLELDIISKVVILYENWDKLNKDIIQKEYFSYLNNEKIDVYDHNVRQTYKDIYLHSKEHFQNDIIVISNSDICFDNTLKRVNELIFDCNILYAISRLQRTVNNKSIYTVPYQNCINTNWSYDTYIFKHPLNINPDDINIKVGVSGCDTYFVKKLTVNNLIKVYNPVFDIRCWHEDYRDENKLTKDYKNQEGYWYENDYPGWAKNWVNCPVSFGANIGLKMTNIDTSLVLNNKYYIKRGLKVITFSLYGDQEKYTKGAIKNAEQALRFYPRWRCWFYVCEETVPKDIIEELRTYPNVDIIFKNLSKEPLGTTWRFLAIDDENVDVMISRDCDSQLSLREKMAVDEWMNSGKSLHIMRDHPHHCSDPAGMLIQGGMFGMKKVSYWPGWTTCLNKYFENSKLWGTDMVILQENVYPLFSRYDDIMIHASFNKFESYARDFPSKHDSDYHFVGEYYFYNGQRNNDHIKILKNALNQ